MPRNPLQGPLTPEEIAASFEGPDGTRFGPILTVPDFAELCRLSSSTIYEWISRGHLKGAVRKRGKHVLIWRDRAMRILFNGPNWSSETAS